LPIGGGKGGPWMKKYIAAAVAGVVINSRDITKRK